MKTQESTDLELIEKISAGDEVAISQFFQEFFPKIRREVASRVFHHYRNDFDEITSIVCLRLLESFRSGRFQPGSKQSLYGYMVGVIRNVINKFATDKIRYDRMVYMDSILNLEIDEDNTVENEEKIEMIKKAMAIIPEEYRTILLLRYFEKYKVADIAEMLEMPREKVYDLLKYGITLLRKSFVELGFVEDVK